MISIKERMISWFKSIMGPLIGLILLSLIFSLTSEKFLTIPNMLNILKAVSTNIMLASSMTLIIIMGGIDISVGSVVGLSGVLAATLITKFSMPIYIGFLVALLVGFFFGAFNGYVISRTAIAPFIVTLATQNIARGICQVLCDGIPVRCATDSFTIIGTKNIFGVVPIIVVYSLFFAVLVSIFLNRTKTGVGIYAVGGNRTAARYSGINVKRIETLPYIISGVFAAFCGFIWTARLGSATPTLGVNFELDAIAATVLGGTSMTGGIGRLSGTMIGVLIIGVINNGLVLMDVNSFYQLIVKGIVILTAVLIDLMRKKASIAAGK